MSDINSLPTLQQLKNWDDAVFEWRENKLNQKVPSETSYEGRDKYRNYTIVMHDFDLTDKNDPKIIFTWVLYSRDGGFEDVFDEAVSFAEILKFHKHNEG